MARNDPTRWTAQKIAKLIARAREKGATLEILGKRYGVSASRIGMLLKRAGVNRELSAQRKLERLEKHRDEKRAIVFEALAKANGRISEAARLTHYGRSTIEIWARKLFTKDDVDSMVSRRACVECGNPVISINPRAKLCSDECRRKRVNKLRQKRRNSAWKLWRQRDYDEFLLTLRLCGGVVHKAAKILGVSRHAAQSAVTKWELRDEVAQARLDSTTEKVEKIAELIKNGVGMMQAADRVQFNKKKIKALLISNGYADVLRTQKCLFCGNLFRRKKVQDRCCSDECRQNLMRARWEKERMRKAAIRNQRKNENVVIESQTIKRSKHL
jgi:predicted nucleic acid-binding Zn ribbon protein/transposase